MAEIIPVSFSLIFEALMGNVTPFPFLVSCLPVVFSDTSFKARGTRPCVLGSETCWLPSLVCPDLCSTALYPQISASGSSCSFPKLPLPWQSLRATSKRCYFPKDNCMWTNWCSSSRDWAAPRTAVCWLWSRNSSVCWLSFLGSSLGVPTPWDIVVKPQQNPWK